MAQKCKSRSRADEAWRAARAPDDRGVLFPELVHRRALRSGMLAGRRFRVSAFGSRFGERWAADRLGPLVPAAPGAAKPRSSCKPA